MWNENTLSDILNFGRNQELCRVSERLCTHLDRPPREEDYNSDLHSIEKADWLVDSFLTMSTSEIEPFVSFVSEHTPFSTQHGVKGEQYGDVIVVFDDIEAAWNNYSFTKMLTPQTSGSPTDGQYERSRRLAYVCFSRAKENLRILLFTLEPEAAKRELVANKLFDESQIFIDG